MKFEEYLEKECSDVGEEFWNTWVGKNFTKLQIAIKSNYLNLRAKQQWADKYCTGKVYFAGSWIFFELEEDSILFTIRWI